VASTVNQDTALYSQTAHTCLSTFAAFKSGLPQWCVVDLIKSPFLTCRQGADERGVDLDTPPNNVEFNNLLDATMTRTAKPRGRTGPAGRLGTLEDKVDKLLDASHSPRTPRSHRRRRPTPHTPGSVSRSPRTFTTPRHRSRRASSPGSPTPSHRPSAQRPLSPAPARGSEIRAFLADLASDVGVFLTEPEVEDDLREREILPDLFPDMDVVRVMELLKITEGAAMRLRRYASSWSVKLKKKRKQGL
jgi:hypothetical protein